MLSNLKYLQLSSMANKSRKTSLKADKYNANVTKRGLVPVVVTKEKVTD